MTEKMRVGDTLSDRAELERRIARLEDKVRAKERTIRALIERTEGPLSGSFELTDDGDLGDAHGGDRLAEPADQQFELQEALEELRRTQAKLLQAQKLEAIGQLAAGIAHEINTPTQYVSNNTAFLQKAFENLAQALEATTEVLEAAKRGPVADELVVRASAAVGKAKIAYLTKHVPRAIAQSLDGLTRISSIVQAMKEFSHPSGAEKQPVNIHESIETSVTIARNEWKYVAEVELDFDDSLPPVPLLRNEFNQVILNLIVNAAHAISAATDEGATGKGRIRIQTRNEGTHVVVRVSDTGSGIPERIRARVFEPFFTTKPVGKGSGQGLAIAYSVIVDKHRGTIAFETQEGVGTSFIVHLPLSMEPPKDSRRGPFT
jgi:two-component system NtrC family sensor kinase